MVRSEWKRNNRLLESACNNTKLPIDSGGVPYERVNEYEYARNCVCRPLTISSPLNIYWIYCFLRLSVQCTFNTKSRRFAFSIDILISKAEKYTNKTNERRYSETNAYFSCYLCKC